MELQECVIQMAHRLPAGSGVANPMRRQCRNPVALDCRTRHELVADFRCRVTGEARRSPNAQAQLSAPEGAAEKTEKGASRNRDWRAVCCLWFCAHRVPGAVPAAAELPRKATTHWGAVSCSARLGEPCLWTGLVRGKNEEPKSRKDMELTVGQRRSNARRRGGVFR
jgi:hypothetical protein